ncbi:MAG: cation diffusion facilitator family transporter [Actinomycetota bacterium]|nr:cation diffusion facilitator family transporter [Actinomycetota bacterium]
MNQQTSDHAHTHEHPSGVRGFFHGFLVPHTHDAADSIDDALESSNHGIRAVKISLAVLGATALVQAGVVVISGSVALLADTIHNFSDALTGIPLWIAFILGRRPPSRIYTYGYGRVEDLAGLFVVVMIALSAVLSGYESIRRLIDPQPLDNLGWVLAAGIIGFAGNEFVALYRIRAGRRIGSAALVADGIHARTDGFTSLAVVLGVIGVWAGFPLADPLIGLVITLAIVVLLWGTGREIGRRLLDGVDLSTVDLATTALSAVDGVNAAPRLQMRWTGHRLNISATLETEPTLTVEEFNTIAQTCEQALRLSVPSVGSVAVRPASRIT